MGVILLEAHRAKLKEDCDIHNLHKIMPPKNISIAVVGCVVVLLVLIFCGIALGSVKIPVDQIDNILFLQESTNDAWNTIVWQIRIPRTITAVLVGGSLGLAGLQMQTLFRNPIADSSILGVTAGATWGVALSVLIGTTTPATDFASSIGWELTSVTTFSAILGAGLVLFIILLAAQKVRSVGTLLIIGLMMSYVLASSITLLLAWADPENIQRYISWGFGSFRSPGWDGLFWLAPLLILSSVIAITSAKQLNAVIFGEAYAKSIGINTKTLKTITLASAAICAGTVTAFCGPITFIGIAAPHIARRLTKTSDHFILIPATILVGAIVATLAEIVAQLPGHDSVLPLNAITALIGAPIVIWVLIKYQASTGNT